MAGPIDVVICLHKAFRSDMSEIDDAAYEAASGNGDLSLVVARLRFFSEMLRLHGEAEDEFMNPALDKVAPDVARAYFLDHRELETMIEGLAQIAAASNPLDTTRATVALSTHLRIHLDKEEEHLFPILVERTSPDEQAAIVRKMAQRIPQPLVPSLIRWWFPLLTTDDREFMARAYMNLMPEQVFAGIKPVLQEAVAEDWAELTRRIPELA